MKTDPKVLIVSLDPFNWGNATGITLSNLFKGWDKDAIAQVYMSNVEPEKDVCTNYFKLSPKTVPFDYYVRKFLRSGQNNVSGVPAAVTLTAKDRSLKNKLHLNFRALADFSPIFFSKDLFRWIEAFNPDVIYCTLGNARMLDMATRIATTIGKPIVPHFMDDWPSTLYTQQELFGFARKIFDRRFNSMLRNVKGGMCISKQMADEYDARYKVPFEAFVTCVDDELFCEPENQDEKSAFTLMYIGGLHLNRWKSLLDISNAIEKINPDSGEIILKIYCPLRDAESYAAFFAENKKTRFEGSIGSDAVPEMLKKASLLIHVESFDANYAQYTRLSISTKIPQYMAAGKPILGYGPEELASMQHIGIAGAGVVWSDKNDLEHQISMLIGDRTKLKEYSMRGFGYAKQFHSKEYNLKRLIETMNRYAS